MVDVNNSIWDSIGQRFERWFQQRFPGFTQHSNGHNGEITPDFCNGSFWVETKTGFTDFGVQIKEYQVRAFHRLDLPVIYLIGCHNFLNSLDRLRRLSPEERFELLDREMDITKAYFVTDAVIDRIWAREHRRSEKEGRLYCTLKTRFLDSIIHNLPLFRGGTRFMPSQYYGIRRSGLLLQPALEGNFQYGAILDTQDDRKAIRYLEKQGLIV